MKLNTLLREAHSSTCESALVIFGNAAESMLNELQLFAFGRRCVLLEIEFYLSSASHPDPFTHCHPAQGRFGKWYLHRIGDGYRGGSFKGIDFTFGGPAVYGGVLVRSLCDEHGNTICGPSLCVDWLLRCANVTKPAHLDPLICKHPIWDSDSPLHFMHRDERSQEAVYHSSRVGLGNATLESSPNGPAYATREYRFFVQPREIKKGRPEMICALSRQGYTVDQIHNLIGSPKKSILKYAADRR